MNFNAIDGAAAAAPSVSRTLSGGDASSSADSFAGTLAKALDAVNTLQLQAHDGARSLANGTAANLHDVTIAMEQANVALQLTAAVRNKVVEAYQEVMRMQV
jgi:flagellar hook-basal body complex protein FliE